MDIPKLTIGQVTADIPIIQGGMGVRVSLSNLAAAVANEGGIGTIASVGLGEVDGIGPLYEVQSREALAKEIQKAKSMTDGHIAVNVMQALRNADDLIKTAVKEGVKVIVTGAGLPLALPDVVPEPDVALVVIVSSARAAELILRTWDRRYKRTVDAIILEGPLAGGHLGFTVDQLNNPDDVSLEKLLPDLLEVTKRFEDKYSCKIPVITAGGIYDGNDIARMLSMGASGVQMATRFVCTHECDVSDEFKQAYLDSKEDDIVIIKSPVGMPGRAIKNKLLHKLDNNEPIKVKCPYQCLTSCKAGSARFCIAKALVDAYYGQVDEGLVFSGKNAYRIQEIVPVKSLIAQLLAELKQSTAATTISQ